MKANRLILILSVIIGYSAGLSAQQATATASASATIVTPISISKVQDLNFGKLAVVSGQGTIVLSPATNNRKSTGGVELMEGSSVSFATFNVSGGIGATFSISLPNEPVVISNGSNLMTVNEFTSTPTVSTTLTDGTKKIIVGATLHVSGNQALGNYLSASPFPVTVNYN
jgi:Domain of unknown function (DUF4402)